MTVTFIPGYWMNELSGQLRPAVMAYLERRPMAPIQIGAIRAYLRQWMQADWRGPMMDVLRSQLEEITTREDIDRWMERALIVDIDPF